MNSFNHYSLGSIGEWLHGRVAGIDQDDESVGYRRLVLRPTVGGRLSWASARYESPRGAIACGWRRTGGGVEIEATVPPGATALLHVPGTDPDRVLMDGAPPASVAGVTVAGPLLLSLAAGSYRVSAGTH
jgi:alpha-L-rhamnosidase